MKTCLICDDHGLVRDALAGMVRMGWPGTNILLAADFPTAWTLAAQAPDFILCDLVMPGAAPLAGIDGILRAAPDTPLMVITGTDDDALLLDLLDRGVAGFAPKSASGQIIEAAIRLILAGGRYLPTRLADIAATRIATGAIAPVRDDATRLSERLTARQLDVLRLMVKGRPNKEIARALGMAPSTVKGHLSQILACLGADNRTDAAIKARLLGIV